MVAKASEKEAKNETSEKFRLGDTRHIISDISKLKALGWQPINSIEKSVRDYVDWLRIGGAPKDIIEYCQSTIKKLEVIQTASLRSA